MKRFTAWDQGRIDKGQDEDVGKFTAAILANAVTKLKVGILSSVFGMPS